MLGFNETSTFVGHFMSSPKEKEKTEIRDQLRLQLYIGNQRRPRIYVRDH